MTDGVGRSSTLCAGQARGTFKNSKSGFFLIRPCLAKCGTNIYFLITLRTTDHGPKIGPWEAKNAAI